MIPALLTRTVGAPSSCATRSTAAPTSASSATFAPTARACPPAARISSTTGWHADSSRSSTATAMPSAASFLATAAPIPRAAPVTIAVRVIGSLQESCDFTVSGGSSRAGCGLAGTKAGSKVPPGKDNQRAFPSQVDLCFPGRSGKPRSHLLERNLRVRQARRIDRRPDRISSRIGSMTSHTLTFIPATTRPPTSQNAMNSRRDHRRGHDLGDELARPRSPTYSMPRSYWSV